MALVEVFTLALLSRWYRMLDDSSDNTFEPEEDEPGLDDSATHILNLFGTYSEDALGDFIKLDKQFNYDADLRAGKVQGSGRTGVIRIEEHIMETLLLFTNHFIWIRNLLMLALPTQLDH